MYLSYVHHIGNNTLYIYCVPAFTDNYQWILRYKEKSLFIDPGDAKTIQQAVDTLQLRPSGILITHKHWDHVDGADSLAQQFDIPIYAPQGMIRCTPTHIVADKQTYNICDIALHVIATPGHTQEHIAWYIPDSQPPIVFVGDTLFAGGCGKLFEGTAQQMYQSILQLLSLPDQTSVYCGHEYTRSNLAFAQHLEPQNTALQQRIQSVSQHNNPTIPTTIAQEKATNPFCRISVLQQQNPQWHDATQAEVFANIRQQKDRY